MELNKTHIKAQLLILLVLLQRARIRFACPLFVLVQLAYQGICMSWLGAGSFPVFPDLANVTFFPFPFEEKSC